MTLQLDSLVDLVGTLLAAVLVLLACAGCGGRILPDLPTVGATTAAATDPAATNELAAARTALAAAQGRMTAARQAIEEARLEATMAPLRQAVTWGTLAGGVLVMAALAILTVLTCWRIDTGRRTLAGVAVGGMVLAASAQALAVSSPWWWVLGLLLVVALLVVALGRVGRHLWRCVAEAAAHGDALERVAIDEGVQPAVLRARVLAVSAQRQQAARLRSTITCARGKAVT